jgi:hypothetical protein
MMNWINETSGELMYNNEFETSDLIPGIYFLRITSDTTTYVVMLIKQ